MPPTEPEIRARPRPWAGSEQESVQGLKSLLVALGKELFDSLSVSIHEMEGVSTSSECVETVILFTSRNTLWRADSNKWIGTDSLPGAASNAQTCSVSCSLSKLMGFLPDFQTLLVAMHLAQPFNGHALRSHNSTAGNTCQEGQMVTLAKMYKDAQ